MLLGQNVEKCCAQCSTLAYVVLKQSGCSDESGVSASFGCTLLLPVKLWCALPPPHWYCEPPLPLTAAGSRQQAAGQMVS